MTDSQGVEGVTKRLPIGRKKDTRYGPWGFFAHPCFAAGGDLAAFGWFNASGPASTQSLSVGGTSFTVADFEMGSGAGAIPSSLNAFAAGATILKFGANSDFAPIIRNTIRQSFWGTDWLTNQSIRFGELRISAGADGVPGMSVIATGCAGTNIYDSSTSAINDSSGTKGTHTFYETPASSTGTGSSDISMFRQSLGGGTSESGKCSMMLYRTVRHNTLSATRYGEVSMGWGGAGWDNHMAAVAPGGAGNQGWYTDATMDAIFSMTPIEGDYSTGGKSGKISIMLGQNKYAPGDQGVLTTQVLTTIARIRDSLTRVGKGSSDILIELVLQWDTTGNVAGYTVAEQVRFDEMDDVFRTIANNNNSLHNKVAYTPLGLEVRDRLGPVNTWAATYLDTVGDTPGAIHPSDSGALYFPTVEVDMYLQSSMQDDTLGSGRIRARP
jgi:hypothetical protein